MFNGLTCNTKSNLKATCEHRNNYTGKETCQHQSLPADKVTPNNDQNLIRKLLDFKTPFEKQKATKDVEYLHTCSCISS